MDLHLSPALTWQQRITSYDKITGFPHSLFIAGDGRVVGTWMLGQDYRNKQQYYGEYPPNYLRRVKALFPDKRHALHLFSGRVDTSVIPGDTVDLNPELQPTYIDNAQTLLNVPLPNYDWVLADPPYSGEDSEHYGITMVRRNTVMRALQRVNPGTHVLWLDQVWPMYRRVYFQLEAVIGIVRSTNHRTRMLFVFRRTDYDADTGSVQR